MNQRTLLLSTVAAMFGFFLWLIIQPPSLGWPVFVISGAAAPFLYDWFRGPEAEM